MARRDDSDAAVGGAPGVPESSPNAAAGEIRIAVRSADRPACGPTTPDTRANRHQPLCCAPDLAAVGFLGFFLFLPLAAVMFSAAGFGACFANLTDPRPFRFKLVPGRRRGRALNLVFGLAASWAIAKFASPAKAADHAHRSPFAVSQDLRVDLRAAVRMQGWFGPWLVNTTFRSSSPCQDRAGDRLLTFPFVARTDPLIRNRMSMKNTPPSRWRRRLANVLAGDAPTSAGRCSMA